MRANYLIIGLIALMVFISACTVSTGNSVSDAIPGGEEEVSSDVDSGDSTPLPSADGYVGTVLGGSKSLYLDYNPVDLELALSQNKVVLLDFYATWCPICQIEQEEIKAAFVKIDNEDLIGFRVNYKDGDTDKNERQLAAKHGIIFQHTKVIIKDGETVFKALDAWDEDRFLSELGRFV